MKISKSDAQWLAQLSRQQYQITRLKGTEPAFTGAYWDCHENGSYRCVCCGAKLFDSQHKFDSGSGWPSFWQAADGSPVATEEDNSLFMRRTEVHCGDCGAHLGHVFPDGPAPSGLRYCINSASLDLKKATDDS